MGLRRAPAVRLETTGVWFMKEHRFVISRDTAFRYTPTAFGRLRARLDQDGVAAVGEHEGRTLWWSAEGFHWEDEGLDAEAVGLLLWDRRRRHDARLDRLRQIRASEEAVEGSRRERIPDDVRAFVWHRDEGRCVRCGAEDDLQFDHVIPVAKGGGVAAENIQVLCGDCNRQKSDSIA
ncbi:MAG: hypothetical protein AMXMBFR23_26670 [Chloroflexota bacterium]